MRISNYSVYSTYTNKNALNYKINANKTGLIDNRKSKSGLSKELVAKIQEFAKNDAKVGDYMTPEYHNFFKAYMHKYISPNRAALMTKASSLIPKLPNPKDAMESFFRYYGIKDIAPIEILLDGKSYSASRKMKYVSIKDKHGDEILSWDINNGWLSHSSREEKKFHRATTNIYAEAYDAARAEMRANGEL